MDDDFVTVSDYVSTRFWPSEPDEHGNFRSRPATAVELDSLYKTASYDRIRLLEAAFDLIEEYGCLGQHDAFKALRSVAREIKAASE